MRNERPNEVVEAKLLRVGQCRKALDRV
jgi:hypothetical protein